MKKHLIIFLLSVTLAATAFAQQAPADSAKVYFRLGHRQYDPAFNSNGSSMQHFLDEVRRQNAAENIESITVRSYASPDGTNAANQRLAKNRCTAITDYLIAETGVDPSLIQSHAEGIAWEELRRMVDSDNRVPWREEVLQVLDNTPLWIVDANGKIVGGRKKSLMDLRGGVPYNWLYANIFPQLRNAVAVSLHVKNPEPALPEPQPTPQPKPEPIQEAEPVTVEETATAEQSDEYGTQPEESDTSEPVTDTTPHDPWHRMAIKTNLIYDALLMPSLEVEYRFNNRWTVNAEAGVAWWKNDPEHKYYQIMNLSGEGRYWFKNYNNRPWHGHYVGLFGGGGKYDLENGGRGYMGEMGYTGVSYGFMFPVSRCISFEAGIGVGYLYTRYKEYIPLDGHYPYQQTSRTNYFGPLKLKFALVWRFWDINKPKKGAKL